MSILNGFDASTVSPETRAAPVPEGKYLCVIDRAEEKASKSDPGNRFLELTLLIIDGEYANRKLWWRLNLENSNEEAVRISRANLSGICRAVGVMRPKDSAELLNIPFLVTVKVKKNRQTDELQNECVKAEPKSSGGAAGAPLARPTPAPTAPAASPAARPATPAQPPWTGRKGV